MSKVSRDNKKAGKKTTADKAAARAKNEENKNVKINDGMCCRCASRKDKQCCNAKSPKNGQYVARKCSCNCFKYAD